MIASRSTNVLLIGARGHARVCLDALAQDPSINVVGAVSHDGLAANGLGVPMIGLDANLLSTAQRAGLTTACVAVGDNAARRRLTATWLDLGFTLVDAVAASAVVSPSASWTPGVTILQGAVVNAASTLGVGAIINTNASIDHDCRIGAFTHVAPGCAIAGGVAIGDGVLVGIGARVLPGVTIGDGAVVGAGAVVTRDVASGDVVIGIPARSMSRP